MKILRNVLHKFQKDPTDNGLVVGQNETVANCMITDDDSHGDFSLSELTKLAAAVSAAMDGCRDFPFAEEVSQHRTLFRLSDGFILMTTE